MYSGPFQILVMGVLAPYTTVGVTALGLQDSLGLPGYVVAVLDMRDFGLS